jgi:hypothetical protein
MKAMLARVVSEFSDGKIFVLLIAWITVMSGRRRTIALEDCNAYSLRADASIPFSGSDETARFLGGSS